MGHFITVFSLLLKRFCSMKKAIMLILILLLTIFIAKGSFDEYEKTLSEIQHFQNLDAEKIKVLRNYTEYSFYGIKSFFVPSPLGILLKTCGTITELSARVDSIAALDIFINAKGSALFEEGSISPFHLSFIIMVLVTISVLFMGYESMRNKEFTRILSSILSQRKIFIYIVISKIILITLFLIGFFSILLILIRLNGITLSNDMLTALSGYFLSAWIMIIGFFSIGVLVGNIKINYLQ